MTHRMSGWASAAAVFLGWSMAATAVAGPAAPVQFAQAADEQPIYGSQLMTPQERTEYRDRMRSATTAEERERIRAEHHDQMQARAQQQGVTLPDEPPATPGRVGPGGGFGPSGTGPGPGGPGRGGGPGGPR